MSENEDKQTPNDNSPEESEGKAAASIRNLLRVNNELFGIVLNVAIEEVSVEDGTVVANIMSGLQTERERYVFSLVIDAAKKIIAQADNYLKYEQDAQDSKDAEVPVISVESIHIEELDIADPTTDENLLAGEHQITLMHTMITDIQRELRSLNEILNRGEKGKVERLVQKTTIKRPPSLETRRKIRDLAEFRQKHIEELSRVPKWLTACQNIPIDPETARNHAPKLRENWSVTTYIWSEDHEDWEN